MVPADHEGQRADLAADPATAPADPRSLLFIGSMDPHSNSYGRFCTLQRLCREVWGIDLDRYLMIKGWASLQYRLNNGPGIMALNAEVLRQAKAKRPDIILVDNKPFLSAGTLKKLRRMLPGTAIVDLLTDDPNGRYWKSWPRIRKTASLYDLFFVQRAANIDDLRAWGAPEVQVCYRSFNPAFHKPLAPGRKDARFAAKVGFIGSYEDVREEYIAYLIRNGIDVQVSGDGWENGKHFGLIKPHYTGPSVYGDAYIQRINGMEIALHFLRHANRDEQDSRTFEIPACRVFMLAERSALHEQLFEPGREAVFFTSKEELLEKLRYYLEHPEERQAIAEAGYDRCYASQYTHEGRLVQVLKQIHERA